MALGKKEEGFNYFRKAIALNPETMESHWNLLTAYIITGESELAEKQLTLMKEKGLNYNDRPTLERLARIYSAAKDYQRVVSLYQGLIELDPNEAKFYKELALAYQKAGQLEEAKQAFQKAAELDSKFIPEFEAFLKSLEK